MADNNSDARREYRRKRRIRNQIIAYIVLVLLLVVIGYAGYKGIKYAISHISVDTLPTVSGQVAETPSANGTASGNETQLIVTPSENEAIVPELTEKPENAAARAYVNSLSTEQKVASLFIVSPEAITGVATATMAGEGTKNALASYQVGGIVYDTKNIQSTDQFTTLVSTTKEMYSELYNTDLWVMVDEGGMNYSIANANIGYTPQSSQKEIGAGGDSQVAYQAYLTIGSYLNQFGIDINAAPVCDVLTNDGSYIADYSFGSDGATVADMVSRAVNGQAETGVMTCLGRFPGEGELATDTATASGSSARTLDDMRSCEFLPFISGIEEGAQFIMVSDMSAEAATGQDVPCVFSSVIIQDVIRGELGFDGVVITDKLNKAAITASYTSGEAAVNAIVAGADMIYYPADFNAAYQAVLAAVNDGTISEERLDEALMRIYSIKIAE